MWLCSSCFNSYSTIALFLQGIRREKKNGQKYLLRQTLNIQSMLGLMQWRASSQWVHNEMCNELCLCDHSDLMVGCFGIGPIPMNLLAVTTYCVKPSEGHACYLGRFALPITECFSPTWRLIAQIPTLPRQFFFWLSEDIELDLALRDKWIRDMGQKQDV